MQLRCQACWTPWQFWLLIWTPSHQPIYQGLRRFAHGTSGLCIMSISPRTPIDVIQWYAVALAAIAALSIIFYLLGISVGLLRTYTTYHFLKYVFYPRVHKYIRGTTRYYALLVLALLVGSIVCLIDNRTKILQQIGLLSVVNLVPLAYINCIISCYGLGYEAYNAIYRWMGGSRDRGGNLCDSCHGIIDA
jgi:hypothetical protein